MRITLHEGMFHQVKRMIKAVGGEVVMLRRESFGPFTAENMKEGEMRLLTREKMEKIPALLPEGRKCAAFLPKEATKKRRRGREVGEDLEKR